MADVNILGAGLADIDNDGDLDLLVVQPHFLFLNNGDGTFADHTSQSGVGEPSNTLSFVDYDNDGFLDVGFGSAAPGDVFIDAFGGLYRNNGNDNYYLRVELVGAASNRSGIGARLIATSGELRQTREIIGGLGYYQDELVAHFGLGQRAQVDELEIRWPSGQVDILSDIATDQHIRVFEGREDYYTVQPTLWIWEKPLPDPLLAGSAIDFNLSVRPTLFEVDAKITQVGVYNVHWDGRNDGDGALASGIYFYRLQAGKRVLSRKLLLLR